MMCGRFTSLTPPEELAAMFEAEVVQPEQSSDLSDAGSRSLEIGELDFRPNFNVAPSMSIFVVARGSDGNRRLGQMTWGLVPSWSKERRGSGHVNARSETIAEKPSFRPSIKHKRCLIPMDGYYEWRTVGISSESSTKQPKRAVYVTRADGRPLATAGLWSTWRLTADAPVIRTCCVITTEANASLATVHDRMPVVLEPEDWSVWLGDEATSADGGVNEALALLTPTEDSVLRMIDVGSLVNSVRNNGPDLIVAVNESR